MIIEQSYLSPSLDELKTPPVPMNTGNSKSLPDPPPLDAPPPYMPLFNAVASIDSPTPTSISNDSQTPTSVLRPTIAQTVNHFELSSTHDTISGTYFIDPLLPPVVLDDTARPSICGPDKGWRGDRENADTHASFHTRHGAISLDLEVVARSPHAQPSWPGNRVPARVFVSSKHGKVRVDVHNVWHHTRSLDLHVENVHGRSVILLPPTFDGPLEFSTQHRNTVHFLPAFAARTRTLRASDRETIVRCFSPSRSDQDPYNPATQDGGDHCFVSTQHGKVIVGISGLDILKEE